MLLLAASLTVGGAAAAGVWWLRSRKRSKLVEEGHQQPSEEVKDAIDTCGSSVNPTPDGVLAASPQKGRPMAQVLSGDNSPRSPAANCLGRGPHNRSFCNNVDFISRPFYPNAGDCMGHVTTAVSPSVHAQPCSGAPKRHHAADGVERTIATIFEGRGVQVTSIPPSLGSLPSSSESSGSDRILESASTSPEVDRYDLQLPDKLRAGPLQSVGELTADSSCVPGSAQDALCDVTNSGGLGHQSAAHGWPSQQPAQGATRPIPCRSPEPHCPPGMADKSAGSTALHVTPPGLGPSPPGLGALTLKPFGASGFGGSLGAWPALDEGPHTPRTPRIRTPRSDFSSESDEMVPPSTPRACSRSSPFTSPPPPSVFATHQGSITPTDEEPPSPRRLNAVPRPRIHSSKMTALSYPQPPSRTPPFPPLPFASASGFVSPRLRMELDPGPGARPQSADHMTRHSGHHPGLPHAGRISPGGNVGGQPFAATASPRQQLGGFAARSQDQSGFNGRMLRIHKRTASDDSSSGRSTPPAFGIMLQPATTMDVEAINKVVDAVLEKPSNPKYGPFIRRFSEPNLAGMAELAQRRRHEEEEVAANGGPDSPTCPFAQKTSLAFLPEDNLLEHRSGSGTLPSRPSKRRASGEEEPPLALRLEFLQGPCAGTVFTTPPGTTEVTLGRSANNTLEISSEDVSHRHAFIRWDSMQRCWKVNDVGSLNGTYLNNRRISSEQARVRGASCTLKTDDLVGLSYSATLKVTVLPGSLVDGEPAGPKMNMYIKPNNALNSVNTLGPAGLLAMLDDLQQVGTRGICVSAAPVAALGLDTAVATITGRDHDRMSQECEDVHCQDLELQGPHPAALFGVMDGHGGRAAADQARHLLPQEVRRLCPRLHDAMAAGAVPADLWAEAFEKTDKQIVGDGGCTATALLVWQERRHGGALCVQAANVGDSAVIFVNTDTAEHRPMTADHRWVNPEERDRIGAQKSQTRMYGLNISRALGDHFLKEQDLGLIAVPYVSQVERLNPCEEGLFIMASDGLWDVTTAEKVAETAIASHRSSGGKAIAVAEALVQHAQDCKTRDDVTVVVVAAKPAP